MATSSDPAERGPVLVVAAHPDDEALGCGATLARHARAGDRVSILFLADGETSRPGAGAKEVARRRACAEAAARCLGAEPPTFLDHQDQSLDTVPRLALAQAVERVAAGLSPRVVYTHHTGDLNVDHQAAALAALTAFRPLPGSSVAAIYGFEVLSSTGWATPADAFVPTRFVEATQTMADKLAALQCYGAEMRPAPHARSEPAVRALAAHRGTVNGMAAAEAFTVLRQLERDA